MSKEKKDIGYVDYHFDPDAHKKNTYNHKHREARKADKLEEEMNIYIQYVKYFLALTLTGFLFIVVGIFTPAWFTYTDVQALQTVELDTLNREISWVMTIEGVKIFMQYCPATGGEACIPEKQGYEQLTKSDHWSTVKGKVNGASYTDAAVLAAAGSNNLINVIALNVLVAIGSASVCIYGLYYKSNRRVCILNFVTMIVAAAVGMAFTMLYASNSEPLRLLLKNDNYYSADINPDMQTDYSFIMTVIGISVLSTAAIPYWFTIPVIDDTVEGSELKAARIMEVNRRVKQYMEDRTNSTHEWEVTTTTVDPKKKLVPVRSNPEGRPHPQPPKDNSPFVKSNDFPMIQPGNRLEKLVMPGQQHTGYSPRDPSLSPGVHSPGAAPGSPGQPSSPTLGSPTGPPQLPGSPMPAGGPPELPTMGGFVIPDPNDMEAIAKARAENPKFDLMVAAKKRRELQARIKKEEEEKNKTVARPGSEKALIEAAIAEQEKRKADGIEEPPPSRPMTRERHVTRSPPTRDTMFANAVPVGVMKGGDRAGLLNNYNVIIEVEKKRGEKKW